MGTGQAGLNRLIEKKVVVLRFDDFTQAFLFPLTWFLAQNLSII
jgi:hypothetical protein